MNHVALEDSHKVTFYVCKNPIMNDPSKYCGPMHNRFSCVGTLAVVYNSGDLQSTSPFLFLTTARQNEQNDFLSDR